MSLRERPPGDVDPPPESASPPPRADPVDRAPRLSLCVITRDEEHRLGVLLDTLRPVVDDIVVVDSGSADGTVACARARGARVFVEPWRGYEAQKNAALAHCAGRWVLSLDADEIPDDVLLADIARVVSLPDGEARAGYYLNRRTMYMGRPLRHVGQPDRKLRLVRRDARPVWKGLPGTGVHEVLTVDGPTGHLRGVCRHDSYVDFAHHMRKTVAFARLGALSRAARGKRSGWGVMWSKPAWAFFREYVLRAGFLDGMPGLIASGARAAELYMRYAFLWEHEHVAPPPSSDADAEAAAHSNEKGGERP